jgi:16S rRNA (cytidine1402-2'-O)-methyltransferase
LAGTQRRSAGDRVSAGPGGDPDKADAARAGTGIVEDAADSGILYVVATPIGNLRDITLRAIEVLRDAPLVAAEDTRVTKRLLARHEIETRTVSFHARSGPSRVAALLEHLRAGSDLALVTDAGTPLVSDPGDSLVAAWAAAGGRVIAIPGASSVTTAVAVSGVTGPRWSFEGFLPRTGRERRERLARIAGDERGSVVFEAPSRIAATLRDLAGACGETRAAAVCRELTKLHETIIRGSLGKLAEMAASGDIPARGEFVIVIGRGEPDQVMWDGDQARAVEQARAEVDRLVAGGVARGDAARRVAATTGLPRRTLYDGTAGGQAGSDRRRA